TFTELRLLLDYYYDITGTLPKNDWNYYYNCTITFVISAIVLISEA
ncbi:22497_t:CDS:1, partial [Gigaspora margarita]